MTKPKGAALAILWWSAVFLLCAELAGGAQRVALEVKNPDGPACAKWPMLTGVPLPKGALQSPEQVRLLAVDGRERPCQVKAVSTWGPKGASIRWVHLDFEADVPEGGKARYQVEFGGGVSRRAVANPLKANQTSDQIEIDTGVLRFRVSRKAFRFIDQAWCDGNRNGRYEGAEQVLKPNTGSGPYVVDHNGVRYDAAKDKAPQVILEESGPMRAVIRAEGWHCAGKTDGLVEGRAGPEAPKDALCKFIVRIVAYRGKPYVRVFHTFVFTADSNKVRLRDIALPLVPHFKGEVRLGLDKGESRSSSESRRYLLQVDDERFEVRGATAKKSKSGRRAPGWFGVEGKRRGLFAVIRDFWQQYPKELEWTGDEMRIHFWPAHGAPVTHPTAKITGDNIHRLWFAHEGRELNFRIPPDYATTFTKKRAHEFYYIPKATKNANALGLSKTHEMLICFARAESLTEAPNNAASLCRLFNNQPAALAPPSWVCAHGLFDRIHPRDPTRFPMAEELIDLMSSVRERLETHTRNMGMFNWGAGHSIWDFEKGRWQVSRTWHNTHHGAPRVPWLLYLRSGDPKYLRKAVRSTRHVIDMNYCRYTTPEFEALKYPRGKIKGALCDYKGLVHWHSGNRLRDYNAMTDFMLYAYYVTGDRRGLEMALEWGEAMKRHYKNARGYAAKPPLSRSGAGCTAALIALYQATWDDGYRKQIDAQIERMFRLSVLPNGGLKGWMTYAPWLTRYVRLTNDKRARRILLRWADALCESLNGETSPILQDRGSYYHVLGEAYQLSRDPKYLAVGLANLERVRRATWRRPAHLYDGMNFLARSSVGAAYFLQMAPEFLAALVAHRGALPEPMPHLGIRSKWSYATGEKVQTHVLYIDNRNGGPFTVAVRGRTRHPNSTRFWAKVISPSGREVARGKVSVEFKGKAYFHLQGFEIPPLAVPGGERGTYILRVEGVGGSWSMSEPLLIHPPKRYVRRICEDPIMEVDGLPVYVWVPKGTKQFNIVRWTFSSHSPHSLKVYGKDGTEVYDRSWDADKAKVRLSIPIQVPSEQENGLWRIVAVSHFELSGRLGISGPIPPVFSLSPGRFFLPEQGALQAK